MNSETLRQYIRLALQERSNRRKKPGGPRTDMGALQQLEPLKFAAQVRATMNNKEGDVGETAKTLDVSPSLIYHWLDSDTNIKDVETSTEREEHEAKDKK